MPAENTQPDDDTQKTDEDEVIPGTCLLNQRRRSCPLASIAIGDDRSFGHSISTSSSRVDSLSRMTLAPLSVLGRREQVRGTGNRAQVRIGNCHAEALHRVQR